MKSEPHSVLGKDSTRKLTKFWRVVGATDEEDCLETLHSPRDWSETQRGIPSLPETPRGGLGTELPVIAESKAENAAVCTEAATMDTSHLAPMSFDGPKKDMQLRDARDMHDKVLRIAKHTGLDPPPYEFLELIGKGSFARVYRCKKNDTGEIVAVKIEDIDQEDYQQLSPKNRSDTIDSFHKEVSLLNQLKEDGRAKNILKIYDAFDFHTQLWIVSEYCTGGSVRTLLRAWGTPMKPQGFDEQFIIPLARELMLAIKSLHDIGGMHRDLKCANVYVTEEGDLRLGDFGIVGEENLQTRRRTVIGTPHYMAPEMARLNVPHNEGLPGYDKNVDVWSYGLTVLEMTTGVPPFSTYDQEAVFRQILVETPRLKGGNHSPELSDFIAFCVNPDPATRPSADDVLKHPFLADTNQKYPTGSLLRLIERYTIWEYKGGQRQSILHDGGAKAPSDIVIAGLDEDNDNDGQDWNFSTSDTFNAAFGRRYSQMVATQDFAGQHFDAPAGSGLPPLNTKDLTLFERLQEEHRELSAGRGEASLDRLWNTDAKPYEFDEHGSAPSDLPLRNISGTAPTRESLIDLDSAGAMDLTVPTFNFDFGDVATLKARASRHVQHHDDDEDGYQHESGDQDTKRATREWKFPSEERKRATMEWTFPRQERNRATMEWTFAKAEPAEPAEPDNPDASMELPPPGADGQLPRGFRPTLKHMATEPVGQFNDFMHPTQPIMPRSGSPVRDSVSSMIDLDMGLADPADIVRPSTASSATGSTMTDMTSGNPFDLEEDPEQNEIDRNRFSYHKQWQSEGGRLKRSSHKTMPMHRRGSSLTSNESDANHNYLSTATDDMADDMPYDYEAQRKARESGRPPLLVADPGESFDMNRWPDFGSSSGFDEEPTYPPHHIPRLGEPDFPLQQGLRTNGLHAPRPLRLRDPRSRSRGPQRELEIPNAVAPHPAALEEDADPEVLMAEMDRMFDDFEGALSATGRALREHTGYEDEETDGEGSASASGMENSNAATGDEDGF